MLFSKLIKYIKTNLIISSLNECLLQIALHINQKHFWYSSNKLLLFEQIMFASSRLGFYFFFRKKSKQKNSQYKKLTLALSHVSGIDLLTLFALSRFYPHPAHPSFSGSFTWSTVVLHQLSAESFSPTGFPAHKIKTLYRFEQFCIDVNAVSFKLKHNIYGSKFIN